MQGVASAETIMNNAEVVENLYGGAYLIGQYIDIRIPMDPNAHVSTPGGGLDCN
jgi:hypothetical protein